MYKTGKKIYPITIRVGSELKAAILKVLVKRRKKNPQLDIRQADVVRDLIQEGSKTLKN